MSTQCRLLRPSGNAQQKTRKTSDSRYTSGYLPKGVHADTLDDGDDGGDPLKDLPLLITAVLLGIAMLYAAGGVAYNLLRPPPVAATARQRRPSELLPHASFWQSLVSTDLNHLALSGRPSHWLTLAWSPAAPISI
jgi:hypothetical protein